MRRTPVRISSTSKPSFPGVKLEGQLFGPTGDRCGIFAILNGQSLDEVDRFVASSPYQIAGLYERVDIHRIEIQSGRIA